MKLMKNLSLSLLLAAGLCATPQPARANASSGITKGTLMLSGALCVTNSAFLKFYVARSLNNYEATLRQMMVNGCRHDQAAFLRCCTDMKKKAAWCTSMSRYTGISGLVLGTLGALI